jgi:hypothetical protein
MKDTHYAGSTNSLLLSDSYKILSARLMIHHIIIQWAACPQEQGWHRHSSKPGPRHLQQARSSFSIFLLTLFVALIVAKLFSMCTHSIYISNHALENINQLLSVIKATHHVFLTFLHAGFGDCSSIEKSARL